MLPFSLSSPGTLQLWNSPRSVLRRLLVLQYLGDVTRFDLAASVVSVGSDNYLFFFGLNVLNLGNAHPDSGHQQRNVKSRDAAVILIGFHSLDGSEGAESIRAEESGIAQRIQRDAQWNVASVSDGEGSEGRFDEKQAADQRNCRFRPFPRSNYSGSIGFTPGGSEIQWDASQSDPSAQHIDESFHLWLIDDRVWRQRMAGSICGALYIQQHLIRILSVLPGFTLFRLQQFHRTSTGF